MFSSSFGSLQRLRILFVHISRLSIVKEGDFIHISITSNGFLYTWSSNIVGVLLAVGSGKIASKDVFLNFLKPKIVNYLLPTAPGHGLCLIAVRY